MEDVPMVNSSRVPCAGFVLSESLTGEVADDQPYCECGFDRDSHSWPTFDVTATAIYTTRFRLRAEDIDFAQEAANELADQLPEPRLDLLDANIVFELAGQSVTGVEETRQTMMITARELRLADLVVRGEGKLPCRIRKLQLTSDEKDEDVIKAWCQHGAHEMSFDPEGAVTIEAR